MLNFAFLILFIHFSQGLMPEILQLGLSAFLTSTKAVIICRKHQNKGKNYDLSTYKQSSLNIRNCSYVVSLYSCASMLQGLSISIMCVLFTMFQVL